ncbi:toll/interleukin-1 receptor domain-containing protein [Mesorhizobium sp. ESP-6-2]|uniref:toll/interleukin-1 receptor domain-containing protein n=1 Tax=Mesorhizobium sp. ESP-6-2 TaxID=2876625 RepID=UPI001CC9689C|nr:toll/interleukin-1 receptor domain-containing protein [Mesorhizobium sp. ESP-6-2]MBZ9806915.1 toll/interleukin-1 receptor domain-containing protein [Mesorhizobium sp. ESP-6-2]
MKSFLSHSSTDKASFISIVADRLGDRAVYDGYNFESGMNTLDEIMRGLSESEVFVLFISNAALESAWVKKEIVIAKPMLDASTIKRFLPILIDKNVDHTDPRIPKWITENYNLRFVAKPTVAVRRITTVFNQLSLGVHPKLDARRKLFVGRNKELDRIERRIDDYSKPLPSALLISGMREIGRKSLLLHSLRKVNKISSTYTPITIPLQQEDGIDGLISKIYDVGIYDGPLDVADLPSMTMGEKVAFLITLLSEFSAQNEILLIDDWRCIVRYGGVTPEWFVPVCEALPPNRLVLAIASATRPKLPPAHRQTTAVYIEKLDELDPEERIGLLVRYLRDIEGIYNLTPDQIGWVRPALNGYPEQAIYAGQLIAEKGVSLAKEAVGEIYDFSAMRASIYVDKYLSNDDVYEFLTFLSWFDFLSIDVISKIRDIVDLPLIEYINEFLDYGICSLIGSVGEYLRLNDVIRDYVARGSLELPRRYSKAMLSISRQVFSTEDSSMFDYSETYASVRAALLAGRDVPGRLLIPAHFLGAISQSYKNRRYKDVIELSYRVLQRSNYETFVKDQARHYLCMALARTRDNRFLAEVQHVKGTEHNYILGFYYRVMGRYDEAIPRLQKAIADGRWEENAKREIVLIHNIQEDYKEAYDLAKESYTDYPGNAITVQAYFEVLLNMPHDEGNVLEIKAALETIKKVKGEKAEEVRLCMEARYDFHILHSVQTAVSKADTAIGRFPRSPYPVLAKLEIGVSKRDIQVINSALESLRNFDQSDQQVRVPVKKAEIFVLALTGQKDVALSKVDSELRFMHPSAKERLRKRILSA